VEFEDPDSSDSLSDRAEIEEYPCMEAVEKELRFDIENLKDLN